MLGLVGLLVVGYVAKRMLAQEQLVIREDTVNIPMALTVLKPGTVITERHIGLGPAAESKMDREVLRTERVVVGRVVRNPIQPAQPIRTSDLYAVGERPPLELSAGMRAVSVSLGDGTSLVDGLIQPEQYVDVLFTPGSAADERGGMIMSLFNGVKVLAINSSQTSTPSLTRGNNNVTLELTPEQSNILLLARQKGDINLTYNPNGLGDGGVAVADENRAYLDEILGLAPPDEPQAPFVTEIYYGAGRQSNSFDERGRLDEANRPPRTINSGPGTQDLEYPSSDSIRGFDRSGGGSGQGALPRGAAAADRGLSR
jgi:pilus assembly protein CpaB